MSSIFKFKTGSILTLGSCAGVIALMSGCGGGGGGGGSSTPSVPGPFDGVYSVVYVPTNTIPNDGKAPTGTLSVTNSRARGQFTYYLQPSVVTAVQKAVDAALRKNGVAGDIRNNQVPAAIVFDLSKGIDGSGKAVFTTSKSVKVCGRATVTVDSTFLATGGGQGTYNVSFPDRFTFTARGQTFQAEPKDGTCNNLPIRIGTATFVRPMPTAAPTTAPTTGPTAAITPLP